MKIFDFRICNLEYNPSQLSSIARIHVRQVGLFLKDRINPFLLLRFAGRFCTSGQPDHLFVLCVAQDLHTPVSQQLTAEIFTLGRKKVHRLCLIVNGADVANLRCAALIHCGKS